MFMVYASEIGIGVGDTLKYTGTDYQEAKYKYFDLCKEYRYVELWNGVDVRLAKKKQD